MTMQKETDTSLTPCFKTVRGIVPCVKTPKAP